MLAVLLDADLGSAADAYSGVSATPQFNTVWKYLGCEKVGVSIEAAPVGFGVDSPDNEYRDEATESCRPIDPAACSASELSMDDRVREERS